MVKEMDCQAAVVKDDAVLSLEVGGGRNMMGRGSRCL